MRIAVAAGIALLTATIMAHELERTQVSISFARDGSFVVDVANDPAWLLLRLEPFAGGAVPAGLTPDRRDRRLAELAPVFVDRTVLFVDGREIRPESVEYVAAAGSYRLRGRLPANARALRWFYGIVIDPYPLTIRHADGRTVMMWVQGEAWSTPIDVSGEVQRTRWIEASALVGSCIALLALRRRARPATKTQRHEEL